MPLINYNLKLKGYVGGWDFDPDYVDYILERNQDSEVNVLIDSLGGSLSAALSISYAFTNHGNVKVHFAGMNASAATIASLGAKKITMDKAAMYLVHKCSFEFFEWSQRNADELQEKIDEYIKAKNQLDKFDAHVAKLYAGKCKKDPKELLDLMKEGGWLTAEEALAWGFIDEITSSEEDEKPTLTQATAKDLIKAGIPVPNIPIAENKTWIDKIIQAIRDNFKKDSNMPLENQQNQQEQTQDQEIQNLRSENQQLQSQITELQKQINELRNKPAETTTNVVNNTQNQETTSDPIAEYVKTMNNCKEIYKNL